MAVTLGRSSVSWEIPNRRVRLATRNPPRPLWPPVKRIGSFLLLVAALLGRVCVAGGQTARRLNELGFDFVAARPDCSYDRFLAGVAVQRPGPIDQVSASFERTLDPLHDSRLITQHARRKFFVRLIGPGAKLRKSEPLVEADRSRHRVNHREVNASDPRRKNHPRECHGAADSVAHIGRRHEAKT